MDPKIARRVRGQELRREGKSYSQIAHILNVSKGAVGHWFKGVDWSKDLVKELSEKAIVSSRARLQRLAAGRRTKLDRIYKKAGEEAKEEYALWKNEPLFAAGLGIYWGEGSKGLKGGQIKVGNVDDRLLMCIKNFLKKYCLVPEEKFRAELLLYPDIDPKVSLKFWSERVMLSPQQFFRPSVILGRHKTRRLPYGLCTLQVSDKRLKVKLLVWLELFAEDLSKF